MASETTAGDPKKRSLTEDLVPILRRPVDPETRRHATYHVLDWLACAIGGLRSDVAGIITQLALETSPGPIHAIGADRRSLDVAVLLNGALGSILELDDFHRTSIVHPGAIVIPAALAMAEVTKATPAAFLDAVVRGYEATIRIGSALGREHYQFWHNTVTAGVFGATAAAGSLLALDDMAMVWALGNAGSTTGGLWQMRNEPVMTKQWHFAEAGLKGLRVAVLASRGFTGPRFILEGPQGLFAATAPGADGTAVTRPAPHWALRDVSFKPWTASRHAHPAIDAALELRDAVAIDDIKAVHVATYREALAFADTPHPRTVLEAKFSLQHSVAIALLRGSPRLADFEPAVFNAAAVAGLRAKVTVTEDPACSARFPAHFGATVTIETTDGRTLSRSLDDSKGDPERPMSLDDLAQKAEQLMVWSGQIDRAEAARVIEAALYLPDSASLQSLLKVLP